MLGLILQVTENPFWNYGAIETFCWFCSISPCLPRRGKLWLLVGMLAPGRNGSGYFLRLEIAFSSFILGQATPFNLIILSFHKCPFCSGLSWAPPLNSAMPWTDSQVNSSDGVTSVPFSHQYLCKDSYLLIYVACIWKKNPIECLAVWISRMFHVLTSLLSTPTFWETWFVLSTPRSWIQMAWGLVSNPMSVQRVNPKILPCWTPYSLEPHL